MEEDQMRSWVTGSRVGRLATVGAGGAPHLVPFCFAVEGDVLYSAVDAKPKRTRRLRRLQNAAREPRVSVLVDHYDEDWTRLWWVRLDGRARELPPGPEAEHAVGLLAAKYAQYQERPPAGPVLRIEVEAWRGWSAS
jgi:PPOX class probable F420-dependent enzyme